MSDYIEHDLVWQGIHITVRHCDNWLASSAELVAQHIEVISENREALPITETGYKSHFMMGAEAMIEFDNDAVKFVTEWLGHAAKSKDWAAKRQLSLF